MKPLLLHYFITNRCNARCEFCDIWRQTPKKNALLEDVTRNLHDARKAGCKFVDFTGGEPLLHPQLPDFLIIARKLGYVTSVTTNCLLFETRAAELRGLVDLLHFSLDGATADVHDSIRGVRSFDAVMRSISLARSLGMHPDLLFTYTDDNICDFPRVAALARGNKLVAILDPVFETEGPDRVSPRTHTLAKNYSRLRGVYLNRAHLALRENGGNSCQTPRCRAVDSTIVVLPDNTLALPCFHNANSFVSIGHSLISALNHPDRQQALQWQGRYLFCTGCHINCYFDPSFTASLDRYTFLSIGSKLSYAWTKYIFYRRRPPWKVFLG
ncbi:MAG: radical SAM protein [Fibrobacterota bacterium]